MGLPVFLFQDRALFRRDYFGFWQTKPVTLKTVQRPGMNIVGKVAQVRNQQATCRHFIRGDS